MENTTDNILVTTTNGFEGYKIVTYLGIVTTTIAPPPFKANEDAIMDQLNVAILENVKKKGGNAVVGVFSSIAFDDGGFPRRYFMTGTCAVVQRIA